MQDDNNISEFKANDQNIIENKELNFYEALIPVIILMAMLAYNIFFVEDQEWFGAYTNQIILLLGGVVAAVVGLFNKVSFVRMFTEIKENLKSIFIPVMILLLVGALAGTWLVSGVIPAMVYYGLQVLSPEIFLPASVIIFSYYFNCNWKFLDHLSHCRNCSCWYWVCTWHKSRNDCGCSDFWSLFWR